MKLPFALARKFVAAETLEQTLPVAIEVRKRGLRTTLDLLGEYINDPQLATRAKNEYIKLVRSIDAADGSIDKNISIKLSMLGQKIDKSFCMDNLHELLTVARDTGTFIRLDMEGTDVTESTLSIFEQVFPDYRKNVGIVLQAYLKRTAEDVVRMCDLQAQVRLCKGAYREPVNLAFQDMSSIREHFLEHMETLISKGNFPGIATHDDILIDATKIFVRSNNIPSDTFEFQMLYGIRPETQSAIAAEGFGMRVYLPFGNMWFPYFYRRLRERKENVWFVLKNMFRK